jgi:hypothetical protein
MAFRYQKSGSVPVWGIKENLYVSESCGGYSKESSVNGPFLI